MLGKVYIISCILFRFTEGCPVKDIAHNPAPAEASLTCCEACLVVDHQAGVQFLKAPRDTDTTGKTLPIPPSLWQGMLHPVQNQRGLRSLSI